MRLAIVRLVVACAISYALDSWLDQIFRPPVGTSNAVGDRITQLAVVYHWLVTSGPHKPERKFTTIVELSEETTRNSVSLLTACRERALTGALLETLIQAHPSVVVLDKWYGDQTCQHDPHDQELNKTFIEGIKKLCKDHAIVVVGRGIKEGTRTTPSMPRFPLDPAFNFKGEKCDCVRESIVNIDPDLRRIYLWRPDVNSVADSKPPPPSMALAAGIAKTPSLQSTSRVGGSTSIRGRPYISFLRSDQFDGAILPAKNLVCGNEPWRACEEGELPKDAICGQPGSWRACNYGETPLSARSVPTGGVVVFGEQRDGFDEFYTVVGKESGFILQANYIESLLDNRVFYPVPETLNILAGLLMLVGFEFILWFYDLRRILALLLGFLFIGVVFVLVYLVVNLAGFYPDPRFSVFSILSSRVIGLLSPYVRSPQPRSMLGA